MRSSSPPLFFDDSTSEQTYEDPFDFLSELLADQTPTMSFNETSTELEEKEREKNETARDLSPPRSIVELSSNQNTTPAVYSGKSDQKYHRFKDETIEQIFIELEQCVDYGQVTKLYKKYNITANYITNWQKRGFGTTISPGFIKSLWSKSNSNILNEFINSSSTSISSIAANTVSQDLPAIDPNALNTYLENTKETEWFQTFRPQENSANASSDTLTQQQPLNSVSEFSKHQKLYNSTGPKLFDKPNIPSYLLTDCNKRKFLNELKEFTSKEEINAVLNKCGITCQRVLLWSLKLKIDISDIRKLYTQSDQNPWDSEQEIIYKQLKPRQKCFYIDEKKIILKELKQCASRKEIDNYLIKKGVYWRNVKCWASRLKIDIFDIKSVYGTTNLPQKRFIDNISNDNGRLTGDSETSVKRTKTR